MISITDISKNNISQNKEKNNNLPFLIINSPDVNTTKLLLKLPAGKDDNKTNIICKLNYQYIHFLLKSNNITPEYFCPLGDIWINKELNENPINILLVNTSVSIKPIDYIKIDNYWSFSIWKPVCPDGYNALGFVASAQKPSINMVRVLSSTLLTEYNNTTVPIRGRNINMNEYDLLTTIGEKFYTINKSMFIKNNEITNKGDLISNDDCDVWSIKHEYGISLLEDDDPWYDEKKVEYDKLSPYSTSINISENFTQDNEDIQGVIPEKPYINFNIIVCSLLLLISLMISMRYYYK
jgi:hypothetical protein